MSKKNMPGVPETGSRGETSRTDVSRKDREIASFYSEEMSKEVVGNLFRSFSDDDAAAEPDSTSTTPSADSSPSHTEEKADKDYIDYINSYSKFDTKDPEPKKIISDAERAQLNRHATRKTSVSLSAGNSGKAGATLKHDTPEDHLDLSSGVRSGVKAKSGLSLPVIKSFLSANAIYAAIGAFLLVMIIFAALIANINSLNAKLKNTAADITKEEHEQLQSDYDELLAENARLKSSLETLSQENSDLENQLSENGISANNNQASDPTATPSSTATTPPSTATAAPSSSPSTATVPPGGVKYTIQDGDTLWGLGVKFYGNGLLGERIADANNMKLTDPLKIGVELIIPQ